MARNPSLHSHAAGHSHPHGGHHHHPRAAADGERRIFWVLLLTGGFMVVEAVGGWLAGSLALIADAGHMLSDTAALALAWAAFRVARRPHDEKRTYGYHRFDDHEPAREEEHPEDAALAVGRRARAMVVAAVWVRVPCGV